MTISHYTERGSPPGTAPASVVVSTVRRVGPIDVRGHNSRIAPPGMSPGVDGGVGCSVHSPGPTAYGGGTGQSWRRIS